nr:immunoglobulin light chain junction region [Macaca mulatta]MOW13931.1 immunoglobulin light chain junction region [Macaca mulatta]
CMQGLEFPMFSF